MSNKSSIYNKHAGYTEGYLQMILGKKRKVLKAKHRQEKKDRKRCRR